jgi:hypothetical protein
MCAIIVWRIYLHALRAIHTLEQAKPTKYTVVLIIGSASVSTNADESTLMGRAGHFDSDPGNV